MPAFVAVLVPVADGEHIVLHHEDAVVFGAHYDLAVEGHDAAFAFAVGEGEFLAFYLMDVRGFRGRLYLPFAFLVEQACAGLLAFLHGGGHEAVGVFSADFLYFFAVDFAEHVSFGVEHGDFYLLLFPGLPGGFIFLVDAYQLAVAHGVEGYVVCVDHYLAVGVDQSVVTLGGLVHGIALAEALHREHALAVELAHFLHHLTVAVDEHDGFALLYGRRHVGGEVAYFLPHAVAHLLGLFFGGVEFVALLALHEEAAVHDHRRGLFELIVEEHLAFGRYEAPVVVLVGLEGDVLYFRLQRFAAAARGEQHDCRQGCKQ